MEKVMQIVLSTNNPGKKLEIGEVFAGSRISLLSLTDVGITGEALEEGETLEENALKKARFAWQGGRWTMADDTGIFIHALGGKPGVHTADWYGGNTDTEKKTLWILEQLKDVVDRSATFKTVAAIISPMGQQYFFTGEVHGQILKAPRGEPGARMPYRPIFMPEGSNKVFAEMTIEEENEISHRGQAFRQAREFLENLLK